MGSLKERLNADKVAAMKSRDAATLTLLRTVLGGITQAETSGKSRVEFTDKDVAAFLRKQITMRRLTAESFMEAGHFDRAGTEKWEADTLEAYLPTLLGEDETRALVADTIATSGASGAKGVGVVMKALSGVENLDRALVSRVARELLTQSVD